MTWRKIQEIYFLRSKSDSKNWKMKKRKKRAIAKTKPVDPEKIRFKKVTTEELEKLRVPVYIDFSDPHSLRERCLMLAVRCVEATQGSCYNEVVLLADTFREYIELGIRED